MWVKGTFLIMFALLIDAAQILVGWMFLAIGLGLQLITPAGGAAGGAGAGAYLCWDSSAGVLAAIGGSLKCAIAGAGIGAAISAFGIPLGTGMAFIIDICISLTMGSGLILALIMCGMFDTKSIAAVFVGEAIPGLDILPGWTLLVVRSILKKNAEEVVGIAGVASSLAAGALSPQNATGLGMITKGLSVVKGSTGAMARRSSAAEGEYGTDSPQNTAKERTQLVSDVKKDSAVRSATIKNDIAPRRTANDNLPLYVQKAA